MSSTESDPSIDKQSLASNSPYTTTITLPLTNELLTPEHSQESSELSIGEGDIEIEHLDTGYDTSAQLGNNICRGKRTVINLWQKAILEEFYRNGMTSASMQPHSSSQHTAAAEKTGLDCEVIKNWIRNRRRPAAVRTAEKLAGLISTHSISPNLLNLTTVPHYHIGTSSAAASTITTTVPLPTHTPLSLAEMSAVFSPPATKRPRLEQSIASAATVQILPSSTHKVQINTPLLVKVRLSEIDVEDFVEVELPSLSYESLLTAVCEELELAPSDVAKIRKLPNVLVRKDRDVHRLREGQELEVVLNSSRVGNASNHVVNILQNDHMPSVGGASVHNLSATHYISSHQLEPPHN